MNKDQLLEQVSQLVHEHWATTKKPLLTSSLGKLLGEKDVQYKEILEGASLTGFLRQHSDRLKIVQHPEQMAKIGLIPTGADYFFEGGLPAQELSKVVDSDAQEGPSGISEDLKKSRGAFYAFIRAISRLEQEEIASIQIPLPVIVKLLEGR